MGVLGARETRGARVVSRPNSLPLPFRTPATQAKFLSKLFNLGLHDHTNPESFAGNIYIYFFHTLAKIRQLAW